MGAGVGGLVGERERERGRARPVMLFVRLSDLCVGVRDCSFACVFIHGCSVSVTRLLCLSIALS